MLKSLFIIAVFMLMSSAHADELYLVLNGKAIHSGNTNYNEKNWGLGFEYDFKPRGTWVPFVAASSFKDSNNQTSNYAGGGYKYRIPLDSDPQGWRMDVGAIAFLMTRKDVRNNKPFIGALPFVSIGTARVMLNATYIPKVSPKTVSLFYFQLKFKIFEF